MSTTRLALEQLLSEAIGDYLEFDTTTNIGAGVTILSTDLKNYDGGQDDYFIDWWVSFQEGVNIAVAPRQVSDYATATGTLTVRGVNLGAEAGAVTLRLHRFNPNNKWRALNRGIEQLYPALYKPVRNTNLVSGNVLPDSSFEWWTSTAVMKMYSGTGTATLLRTTTGGLYRGAMGTTSAKITAGIASDYFYINSDSYPELLDLMGAKIDFYCWAYPQVANDAWIQIYTLQADGTTQTLTSVTTCPATQWTQLALESQSINNDLVNIEIRFGVTTNTKYAYFDSAVLISEANMVRYFLPHEFQNGVAYGAQTNGHIMEVRTQDGGYSTPPCYDLAPQSWQAPITFKVLSDGSYKYIELDEYPANEYQLKLTGMQPVETLTADTSTIYLDGDVLNLIVAKAVLTLYKMEQGPVSSEDKGRYTEQILMWGYEVKMLLPRYTMTRPPSKIRTGVDA